MISIIIPLLALFGISLNLAFSSSLTQPDWALALLLGSLLAHRNNWVWVLPCMLVHDLVLYWSFGASFFTIAMIPVSMIYLDRHLGAGIPQRLLLLIVAMLTLLQLDWGMQAALLTLCLCTTIWHVLTRQYAQKTA